MRGKRRVIDDVKKKAISFHPQSGLTPASDDLYGVSNFPQRFVFTTRFVFL